MTHGGAPEAIGALLRSAQRRMTTQPFRRPAMATLSAAALCASMILAPRCAAALPVMGGQEPGERRQEGLMMLAADSDIAQRFRLGVVAEGSAAPAERFEQWVDGLGRHAAASTAFRKAITEAEHVKHTGAQRITALLQRASGRARSATKTASAYTFVGLAMMCLAAGVIVFLWVSANSQDEPGVQQYKSAMMEGGPSPNAMNPMNSAASLGHGSSPSLPPTSGKPPAPRRGRAAPCC
mmetsp:Transcript_106141/g.307125  ORF Transcript_106141/g.307125 Transcript_106141/m.307125 type:complete len:238 (+) Transcript_106141:60-773(+)